MHHYTYIITNKLNGKAYIGVRSCNCIPENDNYMGSSKYLKQDINEYGLENFSKEIINVYTTRLEAINNEIYLHEKFNVAVSDNFYNRSKQTSNGFDTQGIKLSDEHKQKISKNNARLLGNKHPLFGKKSDKKGISLEEYYGQEKALLIKEKISNREYKTGKEHPNWGKKFSEETRNKIARSRIGKSSWNKDKPMKEETKRKLSEARKKIHVSIHNYKIIDPENNIYYVEKIGLKQWFRLNFNCELPSAIKTSLKTNTPAQRGKWKGWKAEYV